MKLMPEHRLQQKNYPKKRVYQKQKQYFIYLISAGLGLFPILTGCEQKPEAKKGVIASEKTVEKFTAEKGRISLEKPQIIQNSSLDNIKIEEILPPFQISINSYPDFLYRKLQAGLHRGFFLNTVKPESLKRVTIEEILSNECIMELSDIRGNMGQKPQIIKGGSGPR